MITTFEHLFVGRGRVTMAIKVDGPLVKVGLAFCSPKDQFTRKDGRDLASTRFDKAFYSYEFQTASRAVGEIKTEAVEQFVKFVETLGEPHWAMKSIAKGHYCTIFERRGGYHSREI